MTYHITAATAGLGIVLVINSNISLTDTQSLTHYFCSYYCAAALFYLSGANPG